MPTTRSEERSRKAASVQGPSDTEGTAESGTTTETSTSENTTTEGTTSTETVTTIEPPSATAPGPKATAPGTEKIGKNSKSQPPHPQPSKKGVKGGSSVHSKSKAAKIAKAKEELLRLKIELAAAKIAALEEDEDEDQEIEELNQEEVSAAAEEKVGEWFSRHESPPPPMLAIADTPHQGPGEPTPTAAPPAQQQNFSELATAITQAIKAAQRPKFIELPIFSGSHQEWLPFKAAYSETEDGYTAVENLNRLRRNLKGKAREAVESLLITNSQPADIIRTLESRFGRPEAIATTEMEVLRGLPRLSESPRDICIFSTRVTNAVATLKALNCIHYLYNPEVSRSMVEKLTPVLKYRYYDFAAAQPREIADLLKFEKFMRREADLCGPYAQPENLAVQHTTHQQKRPQRINTVMEAQQQVKTCTICNEQHPIYKCEQFKTADVNARWDLAKEHRLCFRCLQKMEKKHTCRERRCGIDGCKLLHNTLLHYRRKRDSTEEESTNTAETINSAWTGKKTTFLKILPVQLTGPAGMVNTFALIDDGSTVTLLDDTVAEKIGATGPIDPLRVETINSTKTADQQSRRVSLKIRGIKDPAEEEVQARTVKNFKVSSQRVTYRQLRGCSHLEDITNDLTYEEARPKILIGQDNWHLLVTSETRTGEPDQPVASRTPLGWVLHGSDSRTLGHRIEYVTHAIEDSEDDRLEQLVKEHFETDNLLLNPRKPKTDPDEQASRILEEHTVRNEDGRYETGLLWKHEETSLPNNYENSLKRLHNIEKKLDRDPSFKGKYNEQMEALISKGYAELAPPSKNKNRTWYLPHFAVINPMKPGKIRVVHDAAAKTRGVSLNDTLLKGPDLLQSLPGVVMRFRQHAIAVTADIAEMFLQVKIKEEDRDALRYLWRGDRRDNQPPEEYRMTSLIFGASSSPSTAIYVKNSNAEKYSATHPQAVSAIVKKHYVDDYLDSFETLEDAIKIASDVRNIHREAKFELKQWKSNSPQLLEALGVTQEDTDTELYKNEEQTERVLGLIWKPGTDELTFNLNLTRIPTALCDKKTPTKREALRIVMSLFDPLGFASPVTIRAKQLLQEIWRHGTQWDEEVNEDIAVKWEDWIEHLKNLANISIPRRYLHYSDSKSLQLHIFTDASESAYSAVLFWRTEDMNGAVNISLIVAKAKVAPLKLTSIPRLELQAAVMGTRLAETVIEEHERKPDSKTFWTDSRTVLTWIKTGSRSYKPYVAHRLAAIEDSSTVNEWRWVPTKMNVADDATRDVPTDFSQKHRWYRGPDFLYSSEESWPRDTSRQDKSEDIEERVHTISTKKKEKLSEALPVVTRFSNWDRLRYATARVLQFIQLCRRKSERVNYKRTKKNPKADPDWKKAPQKNTASPSVLKRTSSADRKYIPITAELLRSAEDLLMRASQEDSFSSEIEDLQRGRVIPKESRLHQLSTVSVNGVLHLRSRIQAVRDVSDDIKTPVILDGDHPTVKLWIQHTHKKLHHSGVEATINECKQQYWVVRLRPVTRSLLRQCLHCRIKTQAPPYPRTGDLPECRLAHHKRPFTHTGVDYFGPLTVTVGRTNQKRYVAIFTCLTTRAIHLEIANSLSTDSAISALRRMMARRGCPEEI